MKRLAFASIMGIVALFFLATTVTSAQEFTSLYSFGADLANGAEPEAATLVQGLDGNYYGTTYRGGGGSDTCPVYPGCGIAFKITAAGKLTTLHKFCSQANCADGAFPLGGLILGANGNFYGVTNDGGIVNWGTFFEITPEGELTTLYAFCAKLGCPDGISPYGGLVQGTDGNFYGTTEGGGYLKSGGTPVGTVFKVTPTGVLTTLYSFGSKTNSNGYSTDGSAPLTTLLLASDGNFYGTTYQGGDYNYGTVFKITPAGKLTTLHSFEPTTEGTNPYAGLVEYEGNFYGTANLGGAGDMGTVYEITPAGVVTTLHSFCSSKLPDCADGAYPHGDLLQAGGNFYSTAQAGGTHGLGTIFEITPTGALTTLHDFNEFDGYPTGGENPMAGLMQSTSGVFYGTTYLGGNPAYRLSCHGQQGCGSIFSLSAGLGPFVQANPSFGKIGGSVNILGNCLGGTTSVTFNGVPATFEVISDSYIKAQVPKGATTGMIETVTPSGPLSSNTPFQILP
jgi:uncharacterized repeat protein (TIGR03803 family)